MIIIKQYNCTFIMFFEICFILMWHQNVLIVMWYIIMWKLLWKMINQFFVQILRYKHLLLSSSLNNHYELYVACTFFCATQVWNDLRASKYWQNFYLWVNYIFNTMMVDLILKETYLFTHDLTRRFMRTVQNTILYNITAFT